MGVILYRLSELLVVRAEMLFRLDDKNVAVRSRQRRTKNTIVGLDACAAPGGKTAHLLERAAHPETGAAKPMCFFADTDGAVMFRSLVESLAA